MKVILIRLVIVLVGAIACAGQLHGQSIELNPGRTLHFAGYTTSPLLRSDQASQIIVTTSTTSLSPDLLQRLKVTTPKTIAFFEPADQAFFWFSGYVESKELSLAVSNEHGWYDFARPSAFANGVTAYSLNNIPANSAKLKVTAYAGEPKLGDKPLIEFTVGNPEITRIPFAKAESQLPATMTSGKYRFVVRRVTSGFTRLLNFNEPIDLKENDLLTAPLQKANLPEQPYSGIAWEFEEAVTSESLAGAVPKTHSGSGVSVHTRWNEYARVTDSTGRVWTADFDGRRRGSGSIEYMETPVNLPDTEGQLSYDFYLVRENGPQSMFVLLAEFAWPDENQIVAPITNTITSLISITFTGKFPEH